VTPAKPAQPQVYWVVEASTGEFLRRTDGTVHCVRAFTPKSAKHMIKQQFGPEYRAKSAAQGETNNA
jgi:hypothetical protein